MGKCWNQKCGLRWAGATSGMRKLQSKGPSVSTKTCNEACYDRCMCAKRVGGGRKLQVMVNGSDCSRKCGGAGVQKRTERRLQNMVRWRAPKCPQLCFDDCYANVLGQRRQQKARNVRKLQSIESDEIVSAKICKKTCNFSKAKTPRGCSSICMKNCVCFGN